MSAALVSVGMEVIGVAATADDGFRQAELEPDVILMDLALPDQSGLAAGKRIVDRWPQARLIAVTALADRLVADEAMRLGFRGYVTKDTSVTQLVNSVASVVDGQIVMPHALAPTRRRRDDPVALLASQLTPRELEVLAMLVEGLRGWEIAARLDVSPNTVRTHVQSILTKLQVHSRLEAAAFAVRHGLVPPPSPPGDHSL
jgi:DNA-binding NarL/FixJ family response regulator